MRGLALGTLVILSLVPRLMSLEGPLLERHGFRQTQTALTAREFVASGIDLLDSELPLFGPPWKAPFEFPLFQAGVAILHDTGIFGDDLDLSCRATALLAFYLSALMLYLLSRHFLSRGATFTVLAAFLLAPFNVLWSRACMIDYTSVAFALAYLLAVARWSRSERTWAWTAGAVVAGTLAGLVKITTVAVVVPALVVVVLLKLRGAPVDKSGARLSVGWRSLPWISLLQVALFALVPLAVSYGWIAHTDAIKASSFPTRWLTSQGLEAWTWGTLNQRSQLDNWIQIGRRVAETMTPGPVLLLPLAAGAGWRRLSAGERLLFATSLLGFVLPIALFFNLYVIHEYYLMAVAPLVAIGTGLGLHLVLRLTSRSGRLAITVIVLALAWQLPGTYLDLVRSFRESAEKDYEALRVARKLRELTDPEDPVLMTQDGWGWNPAIPYYANRRFLIIRQPWREPGIDNLLEGGAFGHAVLHLHHAPHLEAWDKTLLATEGSYEILALQRRTGTEEPGGSLSERFARIEGSLLELTSATPPERLTPIHQVSIRSSVEGIVFEASGGDPFLLLPSLPPGDPRRLLIHIEITAPGPTQLKLFYLTKQDTGYAEERSAQASLKKGPNDLLLELRHPQVDHRLRLDPGTLPGTYVLSRLEIRAEEL